MEKEYVLLKERTCEVCSAPIDFSYSIEMGICEYCYRQRIRDMLNEAKLQDMEL